MPFEIPQIDTGLGIFDKVLNTAIGVRQVENFIDASKQQSQTFRTVEREQGPAIQSEPVDPLVIEIDRARESESSTAMFVRENGVFILAGAGVVGLLIFLLATRGD